MEARRSRGEAAEAPALVISSKEVFRLGETRAVDLAGEMEMELGEFHWCGKHSKKHHHIKVIYRAELCGLPVSTTSLKLIHGQEFLKSVAV